MLRVYVKSVFAFGVAPCRLSCRFSRTAAWEARIASRDAGFVGEDALGINNAGQVVGGSCTSSSCQGFLYSGGSYTNLSVPGSVNTFAFGINNVGQIVGQYDAGLRPSLIGEKGFLYSGGSFTDLIVPGLLE
jgi:probable HAF family extracellular repeat protein